MALKSGKLFILSAPSGAGKTTLAHKLIERCGERYSIERVITYTSKKPRSSEIHGKDYHFISEQEFKEKMREGFFLEWSTTYGAYYGSPREILEHMAQGRSYIAIVDRAGAKALKSCVESATLIWIVPPTLDTLKARLQARDQDSAETIKYRLQLAQKELEEEEKNSFFTHTIVNDSIEDALQALENLIEKELAEYKKKPSQG
jgi:guanylate kinase